MVFQHRNGLADTVLCNLLCTTFDTPLEHSQLAFFKIALSPKKFSSQCRDTIMPFDDPESRLQRTSPTVEEPASEYDKIFHVFQRHNRQKIVFRA